MYDPSVTDKEPGLSKMFIFGTFCILLSLSTSGWGWRERNAWMETTIIHKSLRPPHPLPPSPPANAFARDILFTQCDLFSTDML